jgi:hypothetical protein
MTREQAESVAIRALGFLADDPERIGYFLAQTGINPRSLRQAASDPNFLLGVLDHLAAHEALLCAFAARADMPPEVVAEARNMLAGTPPEFP